MESVKFILPNALGRYFSIGLLNQESESNITPKISQASVDQFTSNLSAGMYNY